MTQEEMERTMQFIVEQQAKNTVGLVELKEAQVRTTATIEALSKDVRVLSGSVDVVTRNVDGLTGIVANLTESVRTMEVRAELDRKEFREQADADRKEFRESMGSMREEFRQHIEAVTAQADSDREEMRYAIDNLILSNEVTRDLANKFGERAVNTSKRVTRLENEISPES
jgi:hypothetical protein